MTINVTTGPDNIKVMIDGTFSPWEVVADTNIQAEYGKAYILDGASPQTITLPAATPGSEGKGFAIKGQSSQLFTIAQNLSQSIDGIGWATTSGVTGGLQSLNRNCTIILISLFDSGLIFGTYGLCGYFNVIGQNITIYNDGLINSENGELLIGSTANGYPQRGNITSPDGSVTITNIPGEIQLTNAGGGSSISTSGLANTSYIQESQNTFYPNNLGLFIPNFFYSSKGDMLLPTSSTIAKYDVINDTINTSFIVRDTSGGTIGMHYYNDQVFLASGSRTDLLNMSEETVTDGVAGGRPGGYTFNSVFDPITNKFYSAPEGATSVLVFDPVALTYSTVANGLLPSGQNSYSAMARSSRTGKIFFFPRNTTTGAIAIFDPVAGTVDLTTLNIGAGSNLYNFKPTEGSNGNIYVPPRSAGNFTFVNPVSLTVNTTSYTGLNPCGGSVLLPNNEIVTNSTLGASTLYVVDLDNGGSFSTRSSGFYPAGFCVTNIGKVICTGSSNNDPFSYFYTGLPTIPVEWCISFMVNKR